MQPFVFNRRVEFYDTDMAGIVHFTALFRYMETAEHELLRSVGIGVQHRDGNRTLGWPRVSCAFDFAAPLRFGDVADVHIGLTKMGNRSLTYTAEVYCNGRRVATGRSTCACCEVVDGAVRAGEIPPAVRAALAPFMLERPST